MKIALLLAAALGLASPALAKPAPVKVETAWCRPAAAGAPSAGCYLTLTAGQADTLVSVSSPAAERVEVHQMDMTGQVMRMSKVERLPLPAGRAVALQPGGMHLMLIRPKAALAAGGSTPLTLKFAKAAPVTVRATIGNAPAATPEHHHH
jgi:copper(I)-binding protein